MAGTGIAAFSGDGGQATTAQLNNPAGIAIDAAGTLYIADTGNHCIRKVESTPGYFAQFGNGQGIFSMLVLVNGSLSQAAVGTVEIKDRSGNPLSARINGFVRRGSFEFSVPAGSAGFYTTEGSLELVTGSVRLTSNTRVGGTILFGGNIGLAGVGAVQPAASFVVPLESDKARGIGTGVALSNLSGLAVDATVTLQNQDGLAVPNARTAIVIAAAGQMAQFPEEIFAGRGLDLGNFRGSLRVEATAPINGMAIRTSPGELATLPVTAAGGGSRLLNFAQFGNGEGVASTLILVNPSASEAATGSARLLDGEGNPLSVRINGTVQSGSFEFNLPPEGVGFFATDGVGDAAVGSVQVTSDNPIGGTVLFAGSMGVAGVGATEPSTGFLAPINSDTSLGVRTAVVLSNPTARRVEVMMRLRDEAGAPIANVSIPVAGNGQIARFPDEIFQGQGIDFSRFRGTLEITSPVPIHGIALRITANQLATLPVTPLE